MFNRMLASCLYQQDKVQVEKAYIKNCIHRIICCGKRNKSKACGLKFWKEIAQNVFKVVGCTIFR